MSKLSAVAERTLGAHVMKIDDIIAQFGGVVTITGLSYSTYKGDKIPVFSFSEGGGGFSFYGGCQKLRELAAAFEEELGDLKSVNADLAEGGVRIRLFPTTRTSTGKPFRPISVIKEPYVDTETGEIYDA